MMGFFQELARGGVEEFEFAGDGRCGKESEQGELEVVALEPFVEPGRVKGVAAPDETVPGEFEEGERCDDFAYERDGELLERLVTGECEGGGPSLLGVLQAGGVVDKVGERAWFLRFVNLLDQVWPVGGGAEGVGGFGGGVGAVAISKQALAAACLVVVADGFAA